MGLTPSPKCPEHDSIKAAHAEAGKAEAAGDVAAFDAWQLAIDALRYARAAVERARTVGQERRKKEKP